MGSSSERSSAPESQLLSRRTLVRAGATAAWTVPLVQVVSAAPAAAAQSPVTPPSNTTTIEITSSSLTYDTSDASKLTFTATVKNKGNVSTSGLQLVATLPANAYTNAPTSSAPTAGSGWTGPTSGG